MHLANSQKIIDLLPFKRWSIFLIAVNLIIILLVVFAQKILPPTIPLFYGNPYGTEQLSSRINLILPSLSALFISIISIIIGILTQDDFLKKVLFGGILATTLLSAITTIKIILLVGNI